MGFSDYATALQMRDLIQKMVQAEIALQRPQYQYGTVTSIDRVKRKCSVLFSSDVVAVPVNMGSVQPREVGQTVRVDGLLGDRFISDVLGSVYEEAPTLNSPTINGTVDGSSSLVTTSYVDLTVNGEAIPNAADLNTYTANGFYTQTSNSQAAAGSNYPRPIAGLLEVHRNAQNDGSHIFQRYTLYGNYSPETYVRNYYTTTGWSTWDVMGAAGALIRVGTDIRTSNTTSTTSAFNICSFTLPSPVNGDIYRIHGEANISPDTAGMFTALQLKHGVNATTGGTQITQNYLDHRTSGRVISGTVTGEFTYTGTTGISNYNVVFVCTPSGGGALCQASATQLAQLYVDRVL